MKAHFTSQLAPYLVEFYQFKKDKGFKYDNGLLLLKKIDSHAIHHSIKEDTISNEFLKSWNERDRNESVSTWAHRFGILNSFIKFSRGYGLKSPTIVVPKFPQEKFLPYVFTLDEMTSIFSKIDNLRLKTATKKSTIHAIPALIRFLYATGCRKGEALNLTVDNVDLKEGIIKIADSKNHKERLLPIGSSLVEVLKAYRSFINQYRIQQDNSFFFIKADGKRIGDSVNDWFRYCMQELEIKTADGYPRIHDLRHTFAVHTVRQLINNSDYSYYSAISVISSYMGHSRLVSTEYYLRLTKSMFPEIIKKMDNFINKECEL